MNQVPAMHIEVIATDNHPTGAGQMATPLVAPAIAQRGRAAYRRAAASHAVHAGAGQEGAGVTGVPPHPKVRRKPRSYVLDRGSRKPSGYCDRELRVQEGTR